METLFAVQRNVPLSEEDRILDERMTRIVKNAIERAQIKGAPVALFDENRNQPYLLYPNGGKRYN